jgi:hypothetical protein
MALIIKQLVIRGEVVEDKGTSEQMEALDKELLYQMIEENKKEILDACEEKIATILEKSFSR